jgi:sec-independent protein translocase protein TatC
MIVRTRHDAAEDLFALTRMPLGDHLEELRSRLFRALAGLGVALFLVFFLDFIGYVTDTPIGIGKPVQDLITQPVVGELQSFYDRRVKQVARELQEGKDSARAANEAREVVMEVEMNDWVHHVAARLGIKVPNAPLGARREDYALVRVRIRPLTWALAMQEAQQKVGKRPTLTTMGVMEAMMVYIKVALVCGIVLASPWVFWHIWSFVAAGLYAHEKRPFYAYLPFSIGLFLAGVLVCQFLVLPKAVEALLWFNEWLGYEPDLRLSEWLGFALLMPLIFGLSFQTPLVMLLLQRVGIVSVAAYRAKRRLAWFFMVIFAGFACPSADAYSMLLLWVPMCLLYELGIVLCRWSPRAEENYNEEEGNMSQTFEA